MDSKEVFHCFTQEGENDSLDTLSNPSTPLCPGTPGVGTPVSDQDVDRSIFSMSMDSGIGSPASYGFQSGSHNITNVRSLKPCENKRIPLKAKSASTVEHSSKEKRRRERIKGSCHQLRVLLPYIRGRKTDMASILEMCVDYLRIVNMCMPQSLQEQIVDLLSKEPGLVVNKDSIKLGTSSKDNNAISAKIKTLLSSSMTSSDALTEGSNKSSPAQATQKDPNLSEIADSFDLMGKKQSILMPSEICEKSSLDSHLDARLEPTLAGHTDIAPRYPNSLYSKTFSSDKNFSRDYPSSTCSGGYNAAQQIYGTYTSNKSSLLESTMYRPSYGSSEGTFYQYYPSLVSNMSSSTRLYNSSDYSSSNVVPSSSLAYPGILSRHETDNEHHSEDLSLV